MSSTILKSLRALQSRASSRSSSLRVQKRPQRSSFTQSCFRKYSTEASFASSSASKTSGPFWLPLLSAPFAAAAFWGSSGNDNTLEKANEDIEKLAFNLTAPTEDTATLASQVIAKVMALPDAEIRRDTMYVLAAVSSAAKIIAEVNPDSPEAKNAVLQAYALAKRISSDSKQTDEIKLDALRCAHKAEYFVFNYRNDLEGMKAILEKDLRIVREHFKTKKQQTAMSYEESSALFLLAAVLGNLDDPSTRATLEESLDIFKGVTKENITPELESVMIERIVSCLTHAFSLDMGEHSASAKEFNRIALALYEQFPRVAVTNTDMPSWKQLETSVKQTTLASGPQ